MKRDLIKANEALVKGAIMAGCTQYYGYPITPASEIAEAASVYMPVCGGTFIQAESEVAAINMVYGASGAGARAMTASSGPGISLKQEGVSYLSGAELPAVIVDIMRAGPGLGNIWPEQGDYNQVVHGGGHGNYKVIVLAPNRAQEMCDLTMLAFDLADKYRMVVYILADAYVGQMMEPVEFPKVNKKAPHRPWALYADKASQPNVITSIVFSAEALEEHNLKLQARYAQIEKDEVRFQEIQCEDAELILMGYGFVSRLLQSTIEVLRKQGKKVGMLRPISLFPFPNQRIQELAAQGKHFLCVELSNGQMRDDVYLATFKKDIVHFYGRMGGMVPSVAEIVDVALGYLK
jgi:pyruvate/2-oxoacid:ferredoxin oxidoreductase alpha subunit